MRTIAILAATLAGWSAAAALAEAADPRSGTSVAFFANNDAEFQEAAQRAAEWCAETYSAPAKYLDARADAAGRVARFTCVLDQAGSHNDPALASATSAVSAPSATR
jgi:hypothetical protein